MFLCEKFGHFPACYRFPMFFVAVLLMGAAGLFGLAADTITHKENVTKISSISDLVTDMLFHWEELTTKILELDDWFFVQ